MKLSDFWRVFDGTGWSLKPVLSGANYFVATGQDLPSSWAEIAFLIGPAVIDFELN